MTVRRRRNRLGLFIACLSLQAAMGAAQGSPRDTALTRQYLGAQVRYLRATEPAYRVALFRVVIGGEYLARAVVRHPGAMPVRDLLAALGGDPGSLPRAQGRTE